MNSWEILGIKPTNDIKLIKQAYAVLLKKYRPEEFPEEFKQIHTAYKNAISEVIKGENQESKISKYKSTEKPEGDIAHDVINTESDTDLESLIVNKTKSLLSKGFYARYQVEQWQFAEKFNEKIELDIRERLARTVLDLFVVYEANREGYQNVERLTDEVLVYLDNIFHWTSNWQSYVFSSDVCGYKNILSRIESYFEFKLAVYRPSYILRLGATLTDLLFATVLYILAFDSHNMGSFILFYMGYRLIFELSWIRNTPGSAILGYGFVDEKFEKPSHYTMLKRNLWFHKDLIAFYAISLLDFWFYLFLGLIILRVLLNLFIALIKQPLIVDKRSKTIAVKYKVG